MANLSFSARADILSNIDVHRNPSRLLEVLAQTISDIANDLADLDAANTSLEFGWIDLVQTVKTLRGPILNSDIPLILQERRAVAAMGQLFGLSSDDLLKSKPESSACLEHLRAIVVELLRREEKIKLYGRCFTVIKQRAQVIAEEFSAGATPWFVLIGLANDAAVNDLIELLATWGITASQTYAHNDGPVLQIV